jgi:hypothetical protein
VDGDGDMDVLGAAELASDITWWENDGNQNFTEHTIQGNFDGARAVYAADVDGDGDMDVLGAATADDITWWENDGSENFTEHTIQGNFSGAQSVYTADVDGDGDVDVLGAAQNANDITWWQNDGSENFTEQTIKGNFNGARSVYTADMDGDGDLDVLGAAAGANDITVWYNTVPEITVLGNNTEITNGDTSPSTADNTDFGTLVAGSELSYPFTISNSGTSATDNLILSGSPAITLSNSTAFTVTQPASTTLAPGESTTFTLTFAPPSEGTFTDTVSISNNDADENPYTFVISGIGDTTPPDISGLSLITPTNGSSLTNPRPTFDWEDATDSVSGVVSYTLLITSSNDSLSLQEATDTITTTLSEYIPSVDLATGVYTWTVRAHDGAGNASAYFSPAATFEIVESSSVSTIYLPIVVKED